MSAYPRCASDRNFFDEAVLGGDSFNWRRGIARLMSAYPRRASERNEAVEDRLTFIQLTRALPT
jgi:hypothetical protein